MVFTMNLRRKLMVTRLLVLAVIVTQVPGNQTSTPKLQSTTVNTLHLPESSVLEQHVFTYRGLLNNILARLKHLEEEFQLYKHRQWSSVLQNVAQNRPTSQSSDAMKILGDGVGASSLAVDGNSDGTFWHGSCTHTYHFEGNRSWWQVDLQSRYDIKSVTIFNRVDCCPERLKNVDIFIYKEDPRTDAAATARLCHHYAGAMPAGANVIGCGTGFLRGRYVRIINALNSDLTLCEVQVFAVPALYAHLNDEN